MNLRRASRSRCENRVPRTIKRILWLGGLLCAFVLAPTTVRLPAQSVAKVHRKVLVQYDPEYPTILKNGHFEGQVRLEATVLPNGNVAKVEPKGGNPMLSQYASQAVMRWKYAPGPSQTIEEVVFFFNSSNR